MSEGSFTSLARSSRFAQVTRMGSRVDLMGRFAAASGGAFQLFAAAAANRRWAPSSAKGLGGGGTDALMDAPRDQDALAAPNGRSMGSLSSMGEYLDWGLAGASAENFYCRLVAAETVNIALPA